MLDALNDMQLARAMADARAAKERGRILHAQGVQESDVHLLFDDTYTSPSAFHSQGSP